MNIMFPSMSSGYDKNIYICLRTLQICRSLPPKATLKLQITKRTRSLVEFLIIMNLPISLSEEVRMSDPVMMMVTVTLNLKL